MSENKDFDAIMREITAGFTGDPTKDMPYLKEKCEEYKNHEMAQEILRACGRLMYEMMPDDKKQEMNKALGNDAAGPAGLDDQRRVLTGGTLTVVGAADDDRLAGFLCAFQNACAGAGGQNLCGRV